MKRALVLFAYFLSACGGPVAPELSELRVSQQSIGRGEELFAQLHVEDPDGDLSGGKFSIHLQGGDLDPVDLESELIFTGVDEGTTSTDAILGLTLDGNKPFGAYLLELSLIDKNGEESDTLETTFNCGPPIF
jgi:hypothetical protein